MRYWLISAEELLDRPVPDLGGRTPLEVAKTPNLDFLAKNGLVGRAAYIPRQLRSCPEIACFSMLGYDPSEYYTGTAPLEAAGLGIQQSDREIIFRSDFVTVSYGEEKMIDPYAGYISSKEAGLLLAELKRKLENDRIKFRAIGGYRNLLIVQAGEEADRLDELELSNPESFISRKYSSFLPKGDDARVLLDILKGSQEILEAHEINRVRIDLKENPANMLWFWGQGKRPKMPLFKTKYKIGGSVYSPSLAIQGLGANIGLKSAGSIEEALNESEFALVFKAAESARQKPRDLKSRIKWIEQFDSGIVSAALKASDKLKDVRILVTADTAVSLDNKSAGSGPVPFLLYGQGVTPDAVTVFNEKNAFQSERSFIRGHELMSFWTGLNG